MYMRVWGDRYSRDLQRYTLAWRMFSLEARTQTIAQWTGLPKERIRTLHRTHGQEASESIRHRGPSPNRVGYFLRTSHMRSEAAALVGMCYAFDLVPPNRMPVREIPSVPRGERLCSAFELYRSLVPNSAVSIDHMILLVFALAQGSDIEVGRCTSCGGIVVMDRFGDRRHTCQFCLDAGGRSEMPLATLEESLSDAEAVTSD
jgi:hypothetical protein